MWIPTTDLPVSPGHPFYARLNTILDEAGFDRFAEEQCRQFYAPVMGRPSLPPGRYFRLLLLGYFEGLDSERGIAWRAADSLAVRRFVGLGLDAAAPDHSTISRTRRLIAVETHRAVFTWVQERLVDRRPAEGADRRHRRDDAGGQRRDAQHRATRHRRALPGVPDATRRGLGHQDADPRDPGAPRPAPEEAHVEPGLEESVRSGREDHEDEGRADAPGAQGRARRGSGQWRARGGDPAGRGCRGHDESRHDGPRRRANRSRPRTARADRRPR